MLPTRLIGRTACFLAICAGTRFRASGSISSRETVIEGTPYWRERDPSSCSSATRFRRRSTDPSLSLVPFCAAIARARPSWVINPCATRTSPRRRLTGWPSVLTAVDAVLGAAVIVITTFARGPAERLWGLPRGAVSVCEVESDHGVVARLSAG